MARLTYLERRGASYYARIDIPLDLVSYFGTTTKKRSLRTKDEETAKRLLGPVIVGWRHEFDEARRRREVTVDDRMHGGWRHYVAVLENDDRVRRSHPTQAEIDAEEDRLNKRLISGEVRSGDFSGMINAEIEYNLLAMSRDLEATRRGRRLARLKVHLANGETALVIEAVGDFAEKNGLRLDPSSGDYRDLCQRFLRAEIEALERTLERDRGDFGGVPRDPIVQPSHTARRERAKPGERIMDLFEQYASQNPRGVTADTLNQARRDISTFVDYVGAGFPVSGVDKKAVREWKSLLLKYPVKASECKDFAGMILPQIVKHNERIGKPLISSRTVNRYLSSFSAFCDWLVSHGYAEQNATEGMSLAKEPGKGSRPFTSKELNALFHSPLFTGCQSADEWRHVARVGNVRIRDHRFWLPLIMLFSGARPAEIAQLALTDVRELHGQWILHITTEGVGDKSVKTSGSMRVVPLHKELIRLGFLDYYSEMQTRGEARLFPKAQRNSRGQMVADFSREFGRYLIRLRIKAGRGLSLYSFRHGAVDALRRAGHLDDQFGFLFGHTKATMTGRYGILPQGMLAQRVDLVNAIDYPGLNLRHLYRQAKQDTSFVR